MADQDVIFKDDGYDELEGVFNKDSEIPGDELTGIIGDQSNDTDDTDDSDTNGSAASIDNDGSSNSDASASDDSGKDDLGKGDNDAGIGDDDASGAANDGADSGKDEDTADGEGKGDNEVEGSADEGSEVELRAQLREQQRKVALTEAKLDTFARQIKADKDADAADKDSTDVPPSDLEAHQIKLNEIAETRGEIVADMLELMKINPKYEDVESVCSKNNLDDTIETLARSQVAKEGGDLVETIMGLEVDIWSQRNPYSYMYGLIKDIHPSYKKTDDDTGDDNKGDASKDGKSKKKTPTKAPLSALDLSRGGGGKDLGEWTAEKIDNLSETDLNKVPAAVYSAYLRGDLDK